MEITIKFLQLFFFALWHVLPVIGFLMALIVVLGGIVGRREGWSMSDSVYYAFITATTVGYGDFHPTKALSKHIAVVISFVGLILTAIIVAVALHAGGYAFKSSSDYDEVIDKVHQIEKGYE